MNAMIDNNAPYAVILGTKYRLKPKTLAVQAMVEEMANLGRDYGAGKLKYEEVLTKQFAFLAATCGVNPFADQALDEVDVDEVAISCIAVINGYENRVKQARLEGMLSGIPTASAKKKKKKK